MSLSDSTNSAREAGEKEDDEFEALKAAVAEEETKRLVADVPRSQHNQFSGTVAMEGRKHKYVLQALAQLYIEDEDIRDRANQMADRLE